MNGPHEFAMQFVADLLKEDSVLARHGVKILTQNDGEIAHLIDKELASLDAPVAVVTVDKMVNVQPGVRISGTIMVTEYVPLNRATGRTFLTALDVAARAQIVLDRPDAHSGDVKHVTPGNGVLTATCAWELELLEKTSSSENN